MPTETTNAIITNPVLIFFIVLVIILMAPLLLKRLKIPHIIGLIVAGVVVGPFGFNLLSRDSSFELFGQVGLLYLMFLVGLEIDMYHLKKNFRRGLGFGIYTFVIPFVLGMLASVYVLHVTWETSILLGAMYSAHTLIAYPIVSRFDLTRTPVVMIAIVGTIIAVIGSLFALAVGVGIYRDGGFQISFIFRLTGLIIVYGLAIVVIYPRLTRWFFKTFSDSISHFLYILSLVFFAAWMAQVIGLEGVLGAFFAGLVLNRYIPAASPLMGRLEFFGNAIFIPYFLVGVGMLIDIRVISQKETLWVAANMIVVALATKWIAAWIAQKSSKMNGDERRIMFGLSSAHTAVALAVAMIGYNIILPDGSHLLNKSILNGTVLMILITCAISPIVTEGAAAREKKRLQKKLAEKDKEEDKLTIDRTLIAVSNPITTPNLMELAMMMRGKLAHDPLYALYVRSDDSYAAIEEAENLLKIAEKTAAASEIRTVPIERYDLNVVTGIMNTVKEKNLSEIIIGLHRKSTVVDSFFGSKIIQLLSDMNKMFVISRCFIPVNIINRIHVCVPRNAEYEVGFRAWVTKLGNLTRQVGCRIIFYANKETIPFIKSIISNEQFGVRSRYKELDEWSDYIMIGNELLEDDLLVMIGARRSSMSFDKEMDNMPSILSKYFNHNNLLLIYPEQFGENHQFTTFSDPQLSDITVAPSKIFIRVRGWYSWFVLQKKKLEHRFRNRHKNK